MSNSEKVIKKPNIKVTTIYKENPKSEAISKDDNLFNKLFSLQKLILKEAGLKELCNK